MKTFNTTGPCDPVYDYQLPPLARVPSLLPLLKERQYVALSGPRQSGKTSVLNALVKQINTDGWGRAVLLSCEVAGQRGGVETTVDAEELLLKDWHAVLRRTLPDVLWPGPEQFGDVAGVAFGYALAEWTIASDRPLVVVLDEVDTLARRPFIALLSQIRSAFERRGRTFPYAVVLAGMRSLRDHDVAMGGDGSGSPFNIVHYVSVSNFTQDEVARLYAQHTAETGQRFTEAAVALSFDQTRGQPWLVNAVAQRCIAELVTNRTSDIDEGHLRTAVRKLETSHPAHLTSLAARLAEERVLRVVAPMVAGDAPDVDPNDVRYAIELGIVDRGEQERLRPANPIYARALLKLVTTRERELLSGWAPAWLDGNGRIDLDRLRDNFLTFWVRHRDMMRDRISYHESVAHFSLMTYLDRVANGGGQLFREFAVGNGRLDLLLVHGDVQLPIEVKVHREDGDPTREGLAQLDRYCEGLRVDRAWLVVFDQRTDAKTPRLEHEEVVTPGGRKVLVVRA